MFFVGSDNNGQEKIRIISARKVTKKEREKNFTRRGIGC